jgi:signal transduction histidine kinase/FixJ family two-component response regulator
VQPDPERIADLKEYPVLYVDDEPENLRIFELTFRRQFGIYTALSGEEGLAILNTKPVALVLSDHRMPGMTGTEFLARVAEIDPHTIRIMVTAYGDAETLQSAINNGSIYRFIPKPWNPDDVRATLIRGIEAYALDRERAQLLQELTVLNRVSAMLNQELELDRLLELMIRTLRTDLGYDGAGVLVRNPDGVLEWARVPSAGDDIDRRLAEIRFGPDNARDFVEQLEDGRSLTLRGEDLLDYSAAVREWVTEVAAEEILVSPLYGKSGLLGAITVDNRRGGHPFRVTDVTLIEGLSNQASVAFENARLVEDLRRTRDGASGAHAIGTLLSGLAREIRNPLGVLESFVARAPGQRGSDGDRTWGEACGAGRQAVERIRAVADTLRTLAWSGGQEPQRELLDADEVVAERVEGMQRLAERVGVALRHVAEPGDTKLFAVRESLRLLVSQLLENALAATPSGGAVEVRSAGMLGGGVEIEVSDSGPGIAEEDLERIFDPFRAAPPGDLNGIGLFVCQRIVTDHGGTLDVRRSDAGGACFRVRLAARPGTPSR